MLSPRSPASRVEEPLRGFLRWAGSKRLLVPQILPVVPSTFNRYFEPFFGSGALFFSLRPPSAQLSDTCQPLVATYLAVKNDVQQVLSHLSGLRPSKRRFLEWRRMSASDPFFDAARFIYLNKVCWNGLYRVNLAGEFNVPYGRPKTWNIIDPKLLKDCAAALRKRAVSLRHSDFRKALQGVKAGDLVYLDPPYVTMHNNNGFVEYNEKLFSWADQRDLASLAVRLADRGAQVIVSNADHDSVIDLYPGFHRSVITRASTLANDVSKRRSVSEVLLSTRKPPRI